MESTDEEVSNVEQKIYIMFYYKKKFFRMFDTSLVSIWLEMAIDWYTTSQGPKKNCIHFSRGRKNPWSAHTARS